MKAKIFIKVPLVILENIAFSMFPKSRGIIERYLFNPYTFNEKHIAYSQFQFEEFCKNIGGISQISNKTILELGPGGSIGFGLLCLKNGAKKYYAIDDGEHTFLAEKQLAFYKKMLGSDESLIKRCFNDENGKKSYNKSLIEFIKIKQGSIYDLPASSIDLIYSCAVLEHVHDPDLCFSEMSRVLKTGGLMNHQVDLRDHIFSQESLRFLLMRDSTFRKLFSKTGEYVNRKRFSHYEYIIKKYNLEVINLGKNILFEGTIEKNLLLKYTESDLRTLSFNITLEKK